MPLVRLFFISVVGSAGVAYAYHGHLRSDRYFFWCGAAMAVYPFFISQPLVSAALAIILSAAPFIAHVFMRKK